MKRKKITQMFFVAAFSFLGMQSISAAVTNPPESLPAAPIHDAEKVLSLYSGAYTNAVGIKGFTVPGKTQTDFRTTVLGDEMIYFEGALNSWTSIKFDNPVDIDAYDVVYADVYLVSGASTKLKVMFQNSTYNCIVATLNEGWNKVEIKLDDFRNPPSDAKQPTPPDFKAVEQIGFLNNSGYARTVYIDNIYAYRADGVDPDPDPDPDLDPDAPTSKAPVPTQSAENVINIFSDVYANSAEFTYSGPGTHNSAVFFTDDNMIKSWNGLNAWTYFAFPAVDLSKKEKLHIDIYTFRTSEGTFKIRLNQSSAIALKVNGGWNSFDLNLADFPGTLDLTAVTQIGLLSGNGYAQNIYLDNIYVYGESEVEPDPDKPSESAAAPTLSSGMVLPIFSDAYSNSKGLNAIDGAGTGTISAILPSDIMVKIVDGLSDWSNINFEKSVNFTNYANLHVDVYVVGESGTVDVKFKLSDGNDVTRTLNVGWNSIDIPMSELAVDLSAINKLSLCNVAAEAKTVYVDNIYAYGLPSAAAIPTHDASDVKSIFSDVYTNKTNVKDFSGTGVGSILTPFADTNEKVIRLADGLNSWAYINFSSDINLGNMDNFHMDVFVLRESGTITLKIKFDDGVEVKRTLNTGWNSIDIPMSEFKGEVTGTLFTALNKLHLIREGGYPQTVYIDNIYAYGINGEEPPIWDPYIPSTAAPIPEHEASVVKSIFSDSYENITTLIHSNPGSPASTMAVVTASEGDDMLRFTSLNWTLIKIDPAIDLSDMDYLHLDVWSTSGAPRLIYGLSDGTTEGRCPEQKIEAAGKWHKINIPLSAFKDVNNNENVGPMTGLKQLRIFSASGFAAERLYFDNIYAFQGGDPDLPSYEIESAYEPIMAPKTIKPIYTEKSIYTNVTDLAAGTAGETTKFCFQKLTKVDETMKLFSLDKMTVDALTPMNLDDMEYIHFNIYKNTDIADASIKIGFKSQNSETVYYAVETPELKDNDWCYLNVSVSELKKAGLDCTSVRSFVFEGNGNFYIDNIFAFQGKYTPGLGEEGKISVDWEKAAAEDKLPDINQPLFGVNLSSACGGSVHGTVGTEYRYPTKNDLYYFKSKGVRLIRFPFRWERVQHELNGELDANEAKSDIKAMKEFIAEAGRIGMYVMPDMHNYCRYTINGTKHVLGEGVVTQEHMADVWKKLAAEFKDYKNIWGYDIQNEPYGLGTDVWKNAAQAIINAIREVDTETAIVIEGESYASSSTWPTTSGKLIDLTDPSDNLIFQAHCYFDRDKSGLYQFENYDQEVRSENQHINRLKPYVDWLKENNQRGILGEFGVPRSDVRWLTMLDEVLEYLKDNGVSGTYWVAGWGYEDDKVSVQPKINDSKDSNYKPDRFFERAQMRILEKYFPVSESTNNQMTETEDNAISVYPNPVVGNVNICSGCGIERIRIFSMSGNLVKESVLGGVDRTNMNVESLSSGIYTIQVLCSDGSVKTQRMVKI
ncbi:cellulase family glycosylhydrolase [Coprobacter sp.]